VPGRRVALHELSRPAVRLVHGPREGRPDQHRAGDAAPDRRADLLPAVQQMGGPDRLRERLPAVHDPDPRLVDAEHPCRPAGELARPGRERRAEFHEGGASPHHPGTRRSVRLHVRPHVGRLHHARAPRGEAEHDAGLDRSGSVRHVREPAGRRRDLVPDGPGLRCGVHRDLPDAPVQGRMSARRQGWVLGVYTAFVFAFLFVPVLMVVLFSFNKTSSFTFPFHGWSLQWYRSVFSSPDYRSAILASLRVALVTVAIVTVIGTLAAIAVTRYAPRGRETLRSILLVPAALPGLFLGIALLSLFIRTKTDLSLGTAAVGHVIYTLPYFFLVASSRLLRFDPMLEESARDLGASSFTTFRKVTLP